MVVTGAETEELSKVAAKRFAKIVVKLGYSAKFKDFKVQNLVGSCGVPFPLRLEIMAADYSMFSSYEPEVRPRACVDVVPSLISIAAAVSWSDFSHGKPQGGAAHLRVW